MTAQALKILYSFLFLFGVVTVLSDSWGSFRIGRYKNTGADQTVSQLVTKTSKQIQAESYVYWTVHHLDS